MNTRHAVIAMVAAWMAALALTACGGGGSPDPKADTTAPTVPSGVIASASSSSQIDLVWSASSDDVGIAGYSIYRGGTHLKDVAGTSATDVGLAASTEYCYAVSARDAAGNESAQTTQSCATTEAPPDTTPPSVPAGLSAVAASSSSIALSWTASTDEVGVTGYRIYRDGGYLASAAGTSASDDGLAASTAHCYTITAYDAAGNESGPSTPACATTHPPDTEAPSVPSGLAATAASDSRVNLSWTASTDGVGVAGYKVYRAGTYLKSVTTTSAFDAGLAASTPYCYTVSAFDAAGNESAPCAESCASTLADATPPSVPQNLTTQVLSSSAIALSWSASTDNTAVAGYKVYRDGSHVASIAGTSTSDTGLSTATRYCFRVSAYDTLGHESAQSSESCATTSLTFARIETGGTDGSIALDANEKAHVSFCGSGAVLKYATNASGSWVVSVVDSAGSVGGETSTAVDLGGHVHVSYHDFTNGDLKYATNASGSWVTTTVDAAGDVGYDTSIRIDAAGAAHIAYYDWDNADLKYATNASGSWVTSTVDSTGEVGRGSSLALDSNGKAHVSYADLTATAPTYLDLKYATNASGSWVVTKIYDGCGGYTSIDVDGSDKVHVAFANSGGYLGYITSKTGWIAESADGGSSAGLGTSCSLALDGSGSPHISYYDTRAHTLKYATKSYGPWSTKTIGAAAAGQQTSIAYGTGYHIVYSDGTSLDYVSNR